MISTLIHANPRAPMDRGILFTSTLFLLVFLASLPRQTPALVRRIAGGFALAGTSILCWIGRTLAAIKRDVISFNRWSYTDVAAYLAAVLFFVMVCQEKHNPIRYAGMALVEACLLQQPKFSCRLCVQLISAGYPRRRRINKRGGSLPIPRGLPASCQPRSPNPDTHPALARWRV